jgi:antibiotic biosynthesis monooxygenase (ABM) superfamily enzyme
MNDETAPCAIAVRLRVRDGARAAFLTWQARITAAAAVAPGFVSIEFIPVLRSRAEWQIVTRFCDPSRLLEWRASPQRALLGRELEALVEGALAPEEEAPDVHAQASVTEVITTRVRAGREATFRDWSARMQRAQAEFPGYRGTYLQAPSGEQPAWTTLVRFATIGQLDAWLASPERRRLLEESAALVQYWSSRRLAGPFAGWFPPEDAGAAPASWKQSMIVLLVLFPIVMIELRFLMPQLRRFDPVFSTFLGNAISVWLLTWPTMPLVNRAFDWWLRPNPTAARQMTPVGIGFLFVLYAIEIATFLWIV